MLWAQKKHKDCEFCLEKSMLELNRDINMLLCWYFKNVSKVGLLKQWNSIALLTISLLKTNINLMIQVHLINIWAQKKLYGWAIRKKLPTCGFALEEVKDLMPERIYKLKKRINKGIFRKLMWSIQRSCTRSITSCYPKRW